MKIIHCDYKSGEVKVKTENLDDLWYLNTIIDSNDLVSSITFRKIKLGGEDERKTQVIKKKVYVTIKVEKVEFHKYSDILRVSGTIFEGPEDIPHGSYHTINVEINTELKITKENWLKYQKDKLTESTKIESTNILAVAFDREEAYVFKITRQGHEFVTSIKGQVAKKNFEQQSTNFYEEIIQLAKSYDDRENYFRIIMASPAFYNDELQKNLKDNKLGQKIVMGTISSVNKISINEIMQRPELENILQKDHTSKEIKLVQELLTNISKNEKYVYSFKESKGAAELGAIDKLLVTDNLIHKYRVEEKFNELESVMKTADQMGAEVHIIQSEHEGGKKLDGLGGIAAILRYNVWWI